MKLYLSAATFSFLLWRKASYLSLVSAKAHFSFLSLQNKSITVSLKAQHLSKPTVFFPVLTRTGVMPSSAFLT